MNLIERIGFFASSLTLGDKSAVSLVIRLVVIIAGAQAVVYLVNLSLFRVVKGATAKLHRDTRRIENISAVIKSLVRYIAYFVAGLMILEALGFDTKALLAGAGIIGLAVGFGAQSLVKDVVTGLFLLFEDQFSVGDHVDIAGVSGIVEEVGIRVTQVRDFSGALHTVPNGSITTTTNWSRGNMRVMVEVPVAYGEDIDKAISILEEMCNSFETQSVKEGPKVLGVTRLGESDIGITIWAMTAPGAQWGIEREIRKRAKKGLEAAGIETPYPRRVVVCCTRTDSEPGAHGCKEKQ